MFSFGPGASYGGWIYSGVKLRFPSEDKIKPFMCALSTHKHTHAGLCVKESIRQIPVYSVGITERSEVRGQTGLHSHIDLTFTSLSSMCYTVLCVICVFMCVCIWFGTYWRNKCVFICRIFHSEIKIFHNLFTFLFFIQGEARFSELFLSYC